MAAQGENERILLIDHDPDGRAAARDYLTDNSYRVFEAEDGRQGLDLYRMMGDELAAVVTDMHPPYLSGEELARINAQERFLPFVACAAGYDPAASAALHRYGVEDFVLKPVTERNLVNVLRAAMLRRRLGGEGQAGHWAGDGDRIVVPATLQDVLMVQGWLGEKARPLFSPHDERVYVQYAHEFIMNAYEHGSLGLHEAEKAELMEAGRYEEELLRREKRCDRTIALEFALIRNMAILTVSDRGSGFDYRRYMAMRAEDDLNRLMMPNGRGILMGRHYFDAVRYERFGSMVALLKRLPTTH